MFYGNDDDDEDDDDGDDGDDDDGDDRSTPHHTHRVFCSLRLYLFQVSRAFAARFKLCIFSFV